MPDPSGSADLRPKLEGSLLMAHLFARFGNFLLGLGVGAGAGGFDWVKNCFWVWGLGLGLGA